MNRCQWCADVLNTKQAKRYCSQACANRAAGDARRIRADTDRRVQRWQRDRAALGLGQVARKRLLTRWLAQRRPCVYCLMAATTIDHVLPLVRGGTHHEGNLAPCCKTCNSSKGGLTVIEWRTGKRLPRMGAPQPAKPKRDQAPRHLPRPILSVSCTRCGEPFMTRKVDKRKCNECAGWINPAVMVINCKHCAQPFTRARTNGRPPSYCTPRCRDQANPPLSGAQQRRRAREKLMSTPAGSKVCR